MTEQTNAELIAEAKSRAELCDADTREAMRDTGNVIVRLAAALEAAEQRSVQAESDRDLFKREQVRLAARCDQAQNERDALAAVVEKVRAWTKVATTGPSGKVQGYTLAQQDARDILETTPADALRELKAEAIREYVTAARENPHTYYWPPSGVLDDAEQWADEIEKGTI